MREGEQVFVNHSYILNNDPWLIKKECFVLKLWHQWGKCPVELESLIRWSVFRCRRNCLLWSTNFYNWQAWGCSLFKRKQFEIFILNSSLLTNSRKGNRPWPMDTIRHFLVFRTVICLAAAFSRRWLEKYHIKGTKRQSSNLLSNPAEKWILVLSQI